MSDRRIVYQHPDGRRLTLPEADFDNPDANPLHHAHDEHAWDADRNATVLRHHAATPVDARRSLKQEGFKPYAYIHPATCDRSCEHDTDVEVLAGHEIKLRGKGRR
jgi:hypothetical protein